jgi:RHS repeat-associated protein
VRFNGGPTPSPVKGLLASAARRLLMKDVVFLHDDHLGSVVAATDGKGALVGERSFTPTGLERSRGGFVDTYGFTGQEHDQSGLIHFQYRDLDPHLARWTSVDPAFQVVSPASATRLGQATGGYAYVGNDFTNNTDPTGLLFGKAISKLKARLKRSKSSSKYSNHEGESHAQAWLSDLHEQNDVYKAHPIDSEYQSYVPSPAASEYANVPIVSEYANVSEVTKGSSANFSPLKAEYVNASKLEISSTEFGRGSSGASGPPSLDPPPLTLAQGIEAVRRTAWMGGPPPGPVRPIERPASHTYERTPTLAHEVPIYNNVSEATVRARSNTVDYQNEDL